jgi:taurine--2-oxoglutarate transaminase
VKNRKTRESFGSYDKPGKEMAAIQKFSREHGLFHYIHDNIILIIPPLVISEPELSEGFKILSQALTITDKLIEG